MELLHSDGQGVVYKYGDTVMSLNEQDFVKILIPTAYENEKIRHEITKILLEFHTCNRNIEWFQFLTEHEFDTNLLLNKFKVPEKITYTHQMMMIFLLGIIQISAIQQNNFNDFY